MGVVYEGHDPVLNRRIAVKTILRNAAIDEETARAYSAQFAREAQAAGRLNHPHIVQVHDFAEQGDVAYLVMEYIQGRELRACFEAHERFEHAVVVRVMGELLDALEFAHESGVIHRDVKPANVMLDAQRRVKLADFGVARIQESERSAAGTMVGTPAFMSPEQIQGGKIDRRTDIFSAGVVLYQLLTGEQPFKGEGAWTVAKQIMQDDPPHPSTVVKSVSPVLDGIVQKALAKSPAERYASAREFAAALRATLGPAQASLPPAQASVPPPPPSQRSRPEAKASEAEVEFWRAIQASADPAEFEFYLEQFPEGTYAPLARHKIAKLNEPLEAARREAEEKARADAEAKARREAEAKARHEAEEQARREAEERAKRDAAARAKREAEERAELEAAERAKREAEAKARREAEEKARREREAQALARLKAQEQAAARAKAAVDEDATVAIPPTRAAPQAQPQAAEPPGRSMLVPAAIAGVLLLAAAAAFLLTHRSPEPAPVAQAPEAPKAAAPEKPAVDVEKVRREAEERVRKEFEAKEASEKAAVAKLQEQKAALEKAAADEATKQKAAAKAAAEKAAAEKIAAAKKAASERAAVERAAAEKAAAERAAAEKAAAEKAAAEKAAAAKAASARPGLPAVGDRWVYQASELGSASDRYQITIETTFVTPTSIGETQTDSNGRSHIFTHLPLATMTGMDPGLANFQPYLGAFAEPRDGLAWQNVKVFHYNRCGESDVTCTATAKVAGHDRVTVPAGTFDAWRVVVHLEMSFGGRVVEREHTYWYAPAVKRFVKQESRTLSTFGKRGREVDMVLVNYTPARAK